MSQYLSFWKNEAEERSHIVPGGFEQPQGAERTMELVEPLIKGKLIDFGCGTGRMAQYYPPENYIGYDISPKMLKTARGRHPEHEFIQRELGEPIDTEGTVLAFAVLVHIPDNIIKKEVEVLKKCGRVVIAEMMDPAFRTDGYTYQRTQEQYIQMFPNHAVDGFDVPNRRYNDKPFTYLVLDR